MPINWIPKTPTIEDQITEEEWKLQELQQPKEVSAPTFDDAAQWTPVARTQPVEIPQTIGAQTNELAVRRISNQTQVAKLSVTPPEEEPLAVPFWQRALQVFAAPFNWVEETIIKPGLALAGTAVGLVPEVERKPGEDLWEWKKRSWAAWETPGIEINVPWSDEPARIDFKGILEFAPWLLIPGAGQVGAGARAARGIAGVLGKFGTAGKALGYAVAFSPWGLVEKTAGAALRGGAKLIGKGAGKIGTGIERKVFGAIPEKKISPQIQRLTKHFDEVVIPARKEFEKALPALRAKQVAKIEQVNKLFREGKLTGGQYEIARRKALSEGGIRAGFATKAPAEVMADTDELMKQVLSASERGLTSQDTASALRNTLLGIDLPEPHHLKELASIFGDDFAKAINKLSSIKSSTKDKLLDFFNIPRAVLASGDLSATARQGLILGITHPTKVPRAFARQIKSIFSEKLALQTDDVMRTDPLFKEWTRLGGYTAPLRKGARLGGREESFMSSMAEKLPFVRRSERGFITYLNELRFGTFKAGRNAMVAQGAGDKELKLLTRFINLASGRGELPKSLEQFAPVLNTILFSPRLQASRLELPRQLGRMLLSKNPYMRKEAATVLVTFVGGGAAVVALANKGETELDPRSGDFGKIKIGETRLDIWTGYLQYIRFTAQMLTGERKSAYGNMNKAQRSEIAWRFLQSKSSPAFGLLVDILKGETYMGDDLFTSTKDVVRSARERLLPLALQDTMDAMEQSGINGLWVGAPAALGVGALTYVNDFVRTKQKIAREMGYETWDEIDPKTQREIQNTNVELQVAMIEFDRQVMGTAWGDWRLAANAIEDNFADNVNKATAQYRETTDGYQYREKISDAWTARRGGYAAREKMPQFEDIVKRLQSEDTAESLIGLGPEQLAIKVYNEAMFGDDMYDEFGDYRFDLARIRKEQLRQQLGDEMFSYVEEYRGLKYEDLPVEFQELSRAKEVMKPYWDVKSWAVRTFGQTWVDSPKGQAFVSRIRKQMRGTNPEMEKYYNMFYKQK